MAVPSEWLYWLATTAVVAVALLSSSYLRAVLLARSLALFLRLLPGMAATVQRVQNDYVQVKNLDFKGLLALPIVSQAAAALSVEVTALSVSSVSFKLPDLGCWTLFVRVDGANAVLRQRPMPAQQSGRRRWMRAKRALTADERRRLDTLDRLLWDISCQEPPHLRIHPNTWLAAAAPHALHLLAVLAMRALDLQLQDTSLLYFQDALPGPWNSEPLTGGRRHREGVQLVCRSLALGPRVPSRPVVDAEAGSLDGSPTGGLLDLLAARLQARSLAVQLRGVAVSVRSSLPPVTSQPQSPHPPTPPADAGDGIAEAEGAPAAPPPTFAPWAHSTRILANWGATLELVSEPSAEAAEAPAGTAADASDERSRPPKSDRPGRPPASRPPYPQPSLVPGSAHSSRNLDLDRPPLASENSDSQPQLGVPACLPVSVSFRQVGQAVGSGVREGARSAGQLQQPGLPPQPRSRARSSSVGNMKADSNGVGESLVWDTRTTPPAPMAPSSTAANGEASLYGNLGEQSSTDKPCRSGHMLLRCEVTLHAFLPTFDVWSLSVLARLAMRARAYSNMQRAWRQRPGVRVAGDPRAWWAHAINLVLQQCRRMRHTANSSMFRVVRLKALRSDYTRCYTALCMHRFYGNYASSSKRWLPFSKSGVLAEVEQLRAMEQELDMEDIVRFRTWAAWHASPLLQEDSAPHREKYSTVVQPILAILSANVHSAFPTSHQAILSGSKAESFFERYRLPVSVAGKLECLRVGTVVSTDHGEGPRVEAFVTDCKGLLEPSFRCTVTVGKAAVVVHAAHAQSSTGTAGAPLLCAPCSKSQLPVLTPLEAPPVDATAVPDHFMAAVFSPAGQMERADMSHSIRRRAVPAAPLCSLATLDSARGASGLSPTAMSFGAYSAHRRAVSHAMPPGILSVLSEYSVVLTDDQKEGAVATLNERSARLTGHEMVGVLNVQVSPLHVIIGSSQLLNVLDVLLKLKARVHADDLEFSRQVGAGTTAGALMAAGSLEQLVLSQLIQNQVTVQAEVPPMIATLSVHCAGVVLQVEQPCSTERSEGGGADGAGAGQAHGCASSAAAPSRPLRSTRVAPGDYHLVMSVTDIELSLGAQFTRLERRGGALSLANLRYDGSLEFEVYCGFWHRTHVLGGLAAPAPAHHVYVHRAGELVWMHPSDQAQLAKCMKDGSNPSSKRALDGGPVPHLLVLRLGGVKLESTCVVPVTSATVAGKQRIVLAGCARGLIVATSPDHIRLLRHLLGSVRASYASVERRAAATDAADYQAAASPPQSGTAKRAAGKAGPVREAGSSNRQITFVLSLPVVTLLAFVPTERTTDNYVRARWAIEPGMNSKLVKTASFWAKRVVPVLDVTVVNLRVGGDFRGSRAASVNASVGALVVHDLQAHPDPGVRVAPDATGGESARSTAMSARCAMYGVRVSGNVHAADSMTGLWATKDVSSTDSVGVAAPVNRKVGSEPLKEDVGLLASVDGSLQQLSGVFASRNGAASRGLGSTTSFKHRYSESVSACCSHILLAQLGLTMDKDEMFDTWRAVFLDTATIADEAADKQQIVGQATANYALRRALVRTSLRQVSVTLVMLGHGRGLQYLAQLWESVSAPIAGCVAPQDWDVTRPEGRSAAPGPHPPAPPPPVQGAPERTPGVVEMMRKCDVTVEVDVESAQVGVWVHQKHFLSTSLHNSSTKVVCKLDKYRSGWTRALSLDLQLADLVVEHGDDMVRRDQLHRVLLQVPDAVTSPLPTLSRQLSSSQGSAFISRQASRLERMGSMAFPEPSRCPSPTLPLGMLPMTQHKNFKLKATQLMSAGDPYELLTFGPQVAVSIQARKPRISLQLSFILDCYFTCTQLAQASRQVFASTQRPPCAAPAEQRPGAQSAADEAVPASLFELKASLLDPCIVVPQTSGAKAALVGTCKRCEIGLPAAAVPLMPHSLGSEAVAGDADAPADATLLMQHSAHVLNSHFNMTHRQPAAAQQPAAREGCSEAPASTGRDDDDSASSSAAPPLAKWLRDKVESVVNKLRSAVNRPARARPQRQDAATGTDRGAAGNAVGGAASAGAAEAPAEGAEGSAVAGCAADDVAVADAEGAASGVRSGTADAEAAGPVDIGAADPPSAERSAEGARGAPCGPEGAAATAPTAAPSSEGGAGNDGDAMHPERWLAREAALSLVFRSYSVFGCSIKARKRAAEEVAEEGSTTYYVPGRSRPAHPGSDWEFQHTVPVLEGSHMAVVIASKGLAHVHIACDDPWLYVSPAGYWHVVDMCLGNFMETAKLDFGPRVKVQPPKRPRNPCLCMWPTPGCVMMGALTVTASHGHVLMQADPRCWEAAAWRPPSKSRRRAPRVPFALLDAYGFGLSVLVDYRNTCYETFVNGHVRHVSVHDLRLARTYLLNARPDVPATALSSRASVSPAALAGPDAGSTSRVGAASLGSDEGGAAVRPAVLQLARLDALRLLRTDDPNQDYAHVEAILGTGDATVTVPVVRLAAAPVNHCLGGNEWAAHLAPHQGDLEGFLDGIPQPPAVYFSFCMLEDATMGTEVTLATFRMEWPWLTDLGLLTAVTSIFVRACGSSAPQPEVQPWFYVNIVLHHVQVCLPVCEHLERLHEELAFNERLRSRQRSAAGHVHTANNGAFHLLAQVMLQALADSGELLPWVGSVDQLAGLPVTGNARSHFRDCRSMSSAAFVFTSRALRYARFSGGDGEAENQLDVCQLAGHALHRHARIQCFLLPCSLRLTLAEHTPLMGEQRQLLRLHTATRKIQRRWRAFRKKAEVVNGSQLLSHISRDDPEEMSDYASLEGQPAAPQHAAPFNAEMSAGMHMVDDYIEARLTDAERRQVHAYKRQYGAPGFDLGIERERTRVKATAVVHKLEVRLSFSHLELLSLVKGHVPILLAASQAGPGLATAVAPALAAATEDASDEGGAAQAVPPSSAATLAVPRKSSTALEVHVHKAAMWLCNDGPHSFGAPDVLQVAVSSLRGTGHVLRDERGVCGASRVSLALRPSVRFLDSASSNWEWLLWPWRVEGEHCFAAVHVDALQVEAPTHTLAIHSQEHAISQFTPSVLLVLGDLRAFITRLLQPPVPPRSRPVPAPTTAPGSDRSAATAAVALAEQIGAAAVAATTTTKLKLPRMEEQMGLSMELTERLPQRYCIQNHLGLRMWYWGCRPRAVEGTHELRPGESHQLRCTPDTQAVTIQHLDGAQVQRQHSTISMQLEGNWSRCEQVLISQVGKVQYDLFPLHEGRCISLIVDVSLIGRTKVISVHSPIWLHNDTGLRMLARLHVPMTLLTINQPTPLRSDILEAKDTDEATELLAVASGRQGSVLSAQLPQPPASTCASAASQPLRRQASTRGPVSTSAWALMERSTRSTTGSAAEAPDNDIHVKILEPHSGHFLPLVALLGGKLHICPQGHDERTVRRDVIHLSSDMARLREQQGYIHAGAEPAAPPAPATSAPAASAGATLSVGDTWLAAGRMHAGRSTTTFLSVDASERSVPDAAGGVRVRQSSPHLFVVSEAPMQASLTLKPTITLANALPVRVQLTVLELWRAAPGGSGSGVPSAAALRSQQPVFMPAGASRPPQLPADRGSVVVTPGAPANVTAAQWSSGYMEGSKLNILLRKCAPLVHQVGAMANLDARHVILELHPGAVAYLHANAAHTVVLHMSVPDFRLSSSAWTVIAWGLDIVERGRRRAARLVFDDEDSMRTHCHLPDSMLLTPSKLEPAGQGGRAGACPAWSQCCAAGRGESARAASLADGEVLPAAQPTSPDSPARRVTRPRSKAQAQHVQQRAGSGGAVGAVGAWPAGRPPPLSSLREAPEAAGEPLLDTAARPGPAAASRAPSAASVSHPTEGEACSVSVGRTHAGLGVSRSASIADVAEEGQPCCGRRVPRTVSLGIHNSGRSQRGDQKPVQCCDVVLFAHLWVVNSSACHIRIMENSRGQGPAVVSRFYAGGEGTHTHDASAPPFAAGADGGGSQPEDDFKHIVGLLGKRSALRIAVAEDFRLDASYGPPSSSLDVSRVANLPSLSLAGTETTVATPSLRSSASTHPMRRSLRRTFTAAGTTSLHTDAHDTSLHRLYTAESSRLGPIVGAASVPSTASWALSQRPSQLALHDSENCDTPPTGASLTSPPSTARSARDTPPRGASSPATACSSPTPAASTAGHGPLMHNVSLSFKGMHADAVAAAARRLGRATPRATEAAQQPRATWAPANATRRNGRPSGADEDGASALQPPRGAHWSPAAAPNSQPQSSASGMGSLSVSGSSTAAGHASGTHLDAGRRAVADSAAPHVPEGVAAAVGSADLNRPPAVLDLSFSPRHQDAAIWSAQTMRLMLSAGSEPPPRRVRADDSDGSARSEGSAAEEPLLHTPGGAGASAPHGQPLCEAFTGPGGSAGRPPVPCAPEVLATPRLGEASRPWPPPAASRPNRPRPAPPHGAAQLDTPFDGSQPPTRSHSLATGLPRPPSHARSQSAEELGARPPRSRSSSPSLMQRAVTCPHDDAAATAASSSGSDDGGADAAVLPPSHASAPELASMPGAEPVAVDASLPIWDGVLESKRDANTEDVPSVAPAKASCWPVGCWQPRGESRSLRRLYELAIDVSTGPAGSCYRFTKMVHLRDKYVLENLTGMALQIKQKSTPDPGVPFGAAPRGAVTLPDKARTPLVWDDAAAGRELVVRLHDSALGGGWEWSGGFTPMDRELYFGLRIHREYPRLSGKYQSVILPVTISVSKACVVLVSFKSRHNLPPYRIVNDCVAVAVEVEQDTGSQERGNLASFPQVLGPGATVPFAWDQPNLPHRLKLSATSTDGRAAGGGHSLDIDNMSSAKDLSIHLKPVQAASPEAAAAARNERTAGALIDFRRLQGAFIQDRLGTQVTVRMEFDGPTRVMRLSDSPSASMRGEAAAELFRQCQLLDRRLRSVSRRFAGLRGAGAPVDLDILGRSMKDRPAAAAAATAAVGADGGTGTGTITSAGPSGQELSLLFAGDLKVTVKEVVGVRAANVTLQVRVQAQVARTEARASMPGGTRTGSTFLIDQELLFHSVSAASELVLDVWDLGSHAAAEQEATGQTAIGGQGASTRLPAKRFLGRCQVGLGETLPIHTHQPERCLPLARRHGKDVVSGAVRLRFDWEVTALSLLRQRRDMLLQVLEARGEILAKLSPRGCEDMKPHVQQLFPPPPAAAAASRPRAQAAAGAGRRPEPAAATLTAQGAEAGSVGAGGAGSLTMQSERVDVSLSVLQVVGVPRRAHSLTAALAANDNPRPLVVARPASGDRQESWLSSRRGTEASWSEDDAVTFLAVQHHDALRITVYDSRRREKEKHAELTLQLSAVDCDSPVYMWVSACLPLHSRRRYTASMLRAISDAAGAARTTLGLPVSAQDVAFAEHDSTQLLLYLRVKLSMHTQSRPRLTASLHFLGLGLLLSRGGDEELCALSTRDVRLSFELHATQASLVGSMQTLQVDDQALDAAHPVILGPAGVVTQGMHKLNKELVLDPGAVSPDARPLVQFRVVRSFAHSGHGSSHHLVHSHSGSMRGGSGGGGLVHSSILSFREISLQLGPADFTAREAFLTAMLEYVVQLPLQDVWQDHAWQRRTRAAVSNADVTPADNRPAAQPDFHRFLYNEHSLPAEDASLLGSWLFIEEFSLSDIHCNVTISLTSNIVAVAKSLRPKQEEGKPELFGGVQHGALGSLVDHFRRSGFQLINVSNVAVQLKGKAFSSTLLSTSSLLNSLFQHYRQASLGESRKVLGGTGPALAQVPFTVIWSAWTMLDLTVDVAKRRTTLAGAVPRIAFVSLTAAAQLIGVGSKMMAAALAFIPFDRSDYISDSELLERYVERPQNAVEALAMATTALAQGVLAALAGVYSDPLTGYQKRHLAGMLVGMVKATLGLGSRPAAGAVEAISKFVQALALVVLGQQGIQGRIVRRVYAPGLARRMQHSHQGDAAGAARCAAWQQWLATGGDRGRDRRVLDVLIVRAHRLLLLTDQHVLYIHSKRLLPSSRGGAKIKWSLALQDINNVSGDDSLTICLRASLRLPACIGAWKIPISRRIRAASIVLFEKITDALNDVDLVAAPRLVGPEDEREGAVGSRQELAALTIVARRP